MPYNRITDFQRGYYYIWLYTNGGSSNKSIEISLDASIKGRVRAEPGWNWQQLEGGPYYIQAATVFNFKMVVVDSYLHAIRGLYLSNDPTPPTIYPPGNWGDRICSGLESSSSSESFSSSSVSSSVSLSSSSISSMSSSSSSSSSLFYRRCVLQARNYVPQNLRGTEFWEEMIEDIQHILNSEWCNTNDIQNKYYDLLALSGDSVQEVIKEMGYGYILDIVNIGATQLRALAGFIPLIHLLKGHRSGLELVLRLLGMTFLIIEWWEAQGNLLVLGELYGLTNHPMYRTNINVSTPDFTGSGFGQPCTFYMKIYVDIDTMFTDTIDYLEEFVRHYVYPILSQLDFVEITAEAAEWANLLLNYSTTIDWDITWQNRYRWEDRWEPLIPLTPMRTTMPLHTTNTDTPYPVVTAGTGQQGLNIKVFDEPLADELITGGSSSYIDPVLTEIEDLYKDSWVR